jgi:acetyl esterase/lipase
MSTFERIEIDLWPGIPPGSEGLAFAEQIDERSPDSAAFRDRAISAITRPRMVVFKPAQADGSALLLAPGGGYQRVVWDKEGVEVAEWLAGLGMTVAVLIYRLPGEGHLDGHLVPLQDAQRALRLLRHHAAAWGLDQTRIGALGFSAGGHVIASLATRFDEASYRPRDAIDAHSARPDFVALGYPVISMDPAIAHAGSRSKLLGAHVDEAAFAARASADLQVRADTPESFILLPDDDAAVPPENSIRYYLALRAAGVPAELHVFRNGGHGFGIRLAEGPVREWTTLFAAWLRHTGRLRAAR